MSVCVREYTIYMYICAYLVLFVMGMCGWVVSVWVLAENVWRVFAPFSPETAVAPLRINSENISSLKFYLESKKYKHFQFGFEGRYKKRMGQNIDRSEWLKSALLELNDSNHDWFRMLCAKISEFKSWMICMSNVINAIQIQHAAGLEA